MIRRAKVADVKAIHKLVNEYARRQEMLPRSLNELYENIRDFFVYEEGSEVGGACAIHILWEDLAEIKSLAVAKKLQNKGVGRALVMRCLKEAKSLGVKRVFALTYRPEFFHKLGFIDIDKSALPQKIWGDCLRCPKFPECDEYAVIIKL